jgi:leucyl aminopeptidase
MEYKTNYSSSTKVDAVINFITEGEATTYNKGVEGKVGEIYTFYEPHLKFSIGTGEGSWSKKIVPAINSAVSSVVKSESANMLVEVPTGLEYEIMLAIMKATYKFELYKTEKSFELSSIYFDFEDDDYSDEMIVPKMLSQAIAFTKDMQNANADDMHPGMLSAIAKDLGLESSRLEVNVKPASHLFPAIEAVGQASEMASVLIEMIYTGNPDDEETTVLVGKGITYDSGGLSLKPSASMADMKFDMSGAAVVMGVMHNMIDDNPRLNLTVLVPAAENAIGGDAYKVGDVINTYSKKTVEVKNTDAEGRLILADALSYASKNYNVKCILDIATLTGAVISALGKDIAGVFCNEAGRSYLDILKDSADSVGENIWELPLNEDIQEGMKSKIADLSNMSTKKGEHGSSSAAAFLSKFVDEDIPWIHIDAAGVLHNEDGGTGWGVRLLSDFVYSID